MTRTNDLANPPAEASPLHIDPAVIVRLTTVLEALTNQPLDPELKCYTPKEAAVILGKTENWVIEAIQNGRIPFTRIGQSPRLTAAHIRWVQAEGERKPNKYSAVAA